MLSLKPHQQILGLQNAAHLLRRTTFCPTRTNIDIFAKKNVQQALYELMQNDSPLPPPKDWETGKIWVNPKPTDKNSNTRNLTTQVKSWWLLNMLKRSRRMHGKMTFFLHTLFPIQQEKVDNATALYHHLMLLHRFALGNLKALAKLICYDNAMLIFLDNKDNVRDRLNENFAREFLELFTIGKGKQIARGNYTNYTEQDVREAAKVLSGYKTDLDFKTFNYLKIPSGKVQVNEKKLAYLHDPGPKFFSGAFQNTIIEPRKLVDGLASESIVKEELDEFIEMIFRQKATAKNFVRKLYRYLVCTEISAETEAQIINPLADTLYNNNYEIKPLLQQLLKSKHFFGIDKDSKTNDKHGSIIKSPLDLTLATINFFDLKLPDPDANLYDFYFYAFRFGIIEYLRYQGMNFYEPPSTAGFPGYFQEPGYHRNWISPNTLTRRYQLIERLVNNASISNVPTGINFDILGFFNKRNNISNPSDPEILVNELTQYLFAIKLSGERIQYFLNEILLDGYSKETWKMEWKHYQKTNDGAGIERQLKKLLVALVQSPEYQLF